MPLNAAVAFERLAGVPSAVRTLRAQFPVDPGATPCHVGCVSRETLTRRTWWRLLRADLGGVCCNSAIAVPCGRMGQPSIAPKCTLRRSYGSERDLLGGSIPLWQPGYANRRLYLRVRSHLGEFHPSVPDRHRTPTIRVWSRNVSRETSQKLRRAFRYFVRLASYRCGVRFRGVAAYRSTPE